MGRDILPYVAETPKIVNAQTTNWTAGPYPNLGWAKRVHPDLEPEEALDRLWDDIVFVPASTPTIPPRRGPRGSRSCAAWPAGSTRPALDAVRFTGPGTDLTVGLLPTSSWRAGSETTVDGVEHIVNIPTEEIFTTPDPARADGVVRATRPLELFGATIEGLVVRFEGGRAVKIDADRGAEGLRGRAASDEGGSRLGEVALVDRESRVGKLGRVFQDTLIDENAASHVALGDAYASPVGRGRTRRASTAATSTSTS